MESKLTNRLDWSIGRIHNEQSFCFPLFVAHYETTTTTTVLYVRVKYAVNTETNEAVAIKILDKDKIQTRNMGAQIKKEISIMKMINHHHVVCVKDVFATSAKIFIVLEFVGGGELFDKIANEGKLSEGQSRFYFKQLVNGLEHCHNNGICHRDLKPEVGKRR